jgi:hypothetical protein
VPPFAQLKTPSVLVIASLSGVSCSDESSGGDPGGTGGSAATAGSGGSGAGGSGAAGSGGSVPQVFEPPLSELEPGWNTMLPGGRTTCSRGTPYRYFVRPGLVNRVVIEFRGGGGCWDGATCAPGSGLFIETATAEPFVVDEAYAEGIRDHSDAENPIKDWHHVIVSYCTGDVHGGDAERTYEYEGQTFTVHHKGAVNARAVLDWVYRNFPSPEKVLVTGCSAGSYGSGIWAPFVRNHYSSSEIYQLGDGGAGVMPDGFGSLALPLYNSQSSHPIFLPNFDPVDYGALQKAYPQIGNAYPDMPMSMFNFNYDDIQTQYYTLAGGGDAVQWSTQMRAVQAEIEAKSPNFAAFIAAGAQHCAINYARFYSVEAKGVRLVNWLKDLVNDVTIDPVDCSPDCGAPL